MIDLDLSLAYSPGVAIPCLEIEKNPETAYDYTTKGNLVAVISNGTAVLGLGNIGALASKPVMEGKSVLFKKFADVDSIDLEVNTDDIDKFVETVANLDLLQFLQIYLYHQYSLPNQLSPHQQIF